LIEQGFHPHQACQTAIVDAMSDDVEMRQGLMEIVRSFFEGPS